MSETFNHNKDSKTEKPTEKKLKDALKKGKVIISKEIYNFFIISAGLVIILFILPCYLKDIIIFLQKIIENSYDKNFIFGSLGVFLKKVWFSIFMYFLGPIFLLLVFLVFFSNFLHHGKFVFSSSKIQLNFENISPVSGLRKIFSKKNLFDFFKSLLKLILIVLIVYYVVKSNSSFLSFGSEISLINLFIFLKKLLKAIVFFIIIILALFAAIDYLYQKSLYIKEMMMTKQEQKDEFKEMEGDPEIKAKIKFKRSALYDKMISSVKEASVVIVNPEHFAVALKYNQSSMYVPVVIAKGEDDIAMVIKSIANKNNIMIISNKVLARNLYKDCKVNNEIDFKYFESVAVIINKVN